MARASFDIHLHDLLDDLLQLGGMVEKAIATSLQALKDRDLKTSERVIKEDDFIDQKRWELEGPLPGAHCAAAADGRRPARGS